MRIVCHVTSLTDPLQLSLKSPEYCGVHDAAAASTPTRLSQHYMIVDLHKKMDVLWSFVKSHLKSKVVIFMSSCKQVRKLCRTRLEHLPSPTTKRKFF